MNAKLAAADMATADSSGDEGGLLNPFVHRLELDTASAKIKTALLTVILLPIRVVLICSLLITGWLLACIGLWGVSEEDLQKKPVAGWRRQLTSVLCIIGKATYRAGGMQVVFKGEQASRKEAPILVIAPHSTFLDGGVVYFTGFPSIIVRRESSANPYIGKLINFTQPVYVWRDDPDSRHNTIKEIIFRATSPDDWPQILIFPEGTCTNRSCLITFKPGAFYPGVPIQPVCIRYPNKLDTVTWTWEGPSALKLIWLTLTQVYSYCEIEFLPVYTPSEEEKRDPKLFANNVRNIMAKALGVPVVDYTYDDCKLMTRAKEMNLPNANSLVEAQKLRIRLGLDEDRTEERLINTGKLPDCKRTNYAQFAVYLNLSTTNTNTHHLFKLYDKESTGYIDFREYLLGVVGITNRKILDILRLGFKIYDSSGAGRLTSEEFTALLTHTLAITEHEVQEIFYRVGCAKANRITYEQFVSYAEKKAEFASLFSIYKDELRDRGTTICPTFEDKKVA